MEKLLTIKEAAAFLKVSEMSLRRWTNAGKLACFRVGGNKERRFDRQDLLNLLQPSDHDKTPLGIGEHRVAASAHIAHFYSTVDECLGDGISYLSTGLARGEKIVVVSTSARLPRLLAGLEHAGFPVGRLIDEGVIATSTGQAQPSEQIRFMSEALLGRDAAQGVRLLGDMAWALARDWSLADMTTLENHTNNALANQNKLFLCQYDMEQFRASAAMMAMATHGLTSYRGALKASPYFSEAI
ncbi:MAG: MEDS domain-containing protein [Deltaproteobacteria bacterium]|jgi:excisionase family DNA binding protein|nr:MEDS domain-containing protein [Deltaproteobacteria bacterium]